MEGVPTTTACTTNSPRRGESHSLVVHELWVLGVAGSNPASPTESRKNLGLWRPLCPPRPEHDPARGHAGNEKSERSAIHDLRDTLGKVASLLRGFGGVSRDCRRRRNDAQPESRGNCQAPEGGEPIHHSGGKTRDSRPVCQPWRPKDKADNRRWRDEEDRGHKKPGERGRRHFRSWQAYCCRNVAHTRRGVRQWYLNSLASGRGAAVHACRRFRRGKRQSRAPDPGKSGGELRMRCIETAPSFSRCAMPRNARRPSACRRDCRRTERARLRARPSERDRLR
jgi:hypothetical protein